MSDRPDPVTRLGPDSGGAPPGTARPGPGGSASGGSAFRVYRWDWGPDDDRRPGLPWIGIFLLVFGGLLLLQQVYPQFRTAGSLLGLAVGLAFLIKWLIDRGTGSLYAGAIITALAAPGVIQAAGVQADGLTTFCLGVAFLFIAVVRAVSGGGFGWQAWIGALLAVVGGASITNASVGAYLVPILLIGLGAVLLLRDVGRRGAG